MLTQSDDLLGVADRGGCRFGGLDRTAASSGRRWMREPQANDRVDAGAWQGPGRDGPRMRRQGASEEATRQEGVAAPLVRRTRALRHGVEGHPARRGRLFDMPRNPSPVRASGPRQSDVLEGRARASEIVEQNVIRPEVVGAAREEGRRGHGAR